MMIKRIFKVLILILVCSFLFCCSDFDFQIITENIVYLNRTIDLGINGVDGLEYTISFESSNDEIAKVDDNGKVLGLKEGSVIISVTVNDLTKEVEITVVNPNTIFVNEKQSAIDTLFNYKDEEDYSTINWNAINSYIMSGTAEIEECITISSITDTLNKYKSKIDEINTLTEELEILNEYKDSKIVSLRKTVDLQQYKEIEKNAINNYLINAEYLINNSNDKNSIDKIELKTIEKIQFIKTSQSQYNKDLLKSFYDDQLKNINYQNDNYYQIFVRSFSDSNNDGIGDLNGITEKLDYISSMGFTAIWLMPINDSASYHGYDVIDYYSIKDEYGTISDLEKLITEANKLGIKVILDMVFNHTSDQNIWFKKALDGDEKYQNYYNFGAKGGNYGDHWHNSNIGSYYGYFSNSMPDLRMVNEDVQKEIINISKFYINLGVQGFRLDAANHYFDYNENAPDNIFYNNYFLSNVRFFQEKYTKILKDYYDKFFIFGEIYEQTNYNIVADYYYGIDAPIDFPTQKLLLDTASKVSVSSYVKKLSTIYNAYKNVNSNFTSLPFITNHDMDRLASYYNGNITYLRLGAEMLLTLPGSPIVYYGEEMGMFGTKTPGINNIWDETRRLPINFGDSFTTSWTSSFNYDLYNELLEKNQNIGSVKEQLEDKNSLLNVYKELLKIRNENIALKFGNNFSAWSGNSSTVQGFIREYEYESRKQKVLVLHNFSNNVKDIGSITGKVLYYSNVENIDSLNTLTQLQPKSTIIIDITEVE